MLPVVGPVETGVKLFEFPDLSLHSDTTPRLDVMVEESEESNHILSPETDNGENLAPLGPIPIP